MKTVAVIQPYFLPYAGYFRLFEAADCVVIFDCVQFPRRGWVHRNRFRLANGDFDWLTLPIERAERSALIASLHFASDARERMKEAIRRFPVLERARAEQNPALEMLFKMDDDAVSSYLVDLLHYFSDRLQIRFEPIISSALNIDPVLRGQERVIAIVEAVGGTRYVNPSGGRSLYDPARFSDSKIELRFLSEYSGDAGSILERILNEGPEAVASDIREQTILLP
ncbi:MAG: hypothetical protein HKL91_04390 [Candidatus Eremiobacteraeota bacterium]|uniref:WbqC-like protein family protein n=1 Tax=mine drainage metagenome TaxID=410659 RepID=E6PC94_9ZZZZ|nr:hypothetical protein [Candidatus Eremiobacteraeota bacterium]